MVAQSINSSQNVNFPSDHSEGNTLDIKALFLRFLRNWYWFALALAVTLTAAWLYLRYTVPTYKVSGTVLLKEKQYNKSLLSEDNNNSDIVLDFIGVNSNNKVSNELQILKSRSLMRKVVEELEISTTYFAEGVVLSTELYANIPIKLSLVEPVEGAYGTVLRIKLLDRNRFALVRTEGDTLLCRYGRPFKLNEIRYRIDRLEELPKTYSDVEIHFDNPQKVASYYSKKLELKQIEDSQVIAVGLEDSNPDKAIAIINQLIIQYNEQELENKNRVSSNTLEFIDERLGYISKELFQAEREVETYKSRNQVPLELGSSAEQLFNKINATDEQLVNLELRQTMLDQLERTLSTETGQFDYLPASAEIAGGVLAELFTRYNTLLEEREKLLASATSSNPVVNVLEEQISDLRANILNSIVVIKQELKSQKAALEQQLNPILERIEAVPRNERELLEIMRQKEIKQTLFLFLLQKKEETALNMAAQIANTRILDAPTNRGLVAPIGIRIYLIGFMLGIGIPGGLLFMSEQFDRAVHTKNDVRQVTDAPFLGTIMQSNSGNPVVVQDGNESAVAEMFRLLHTNLQFMLPVNTKPVILVTSSGGKDGKTFVSLNLALSMAQSGKKTVVVEADLRKPTLSRNLTGKNTETGLTNYLLEQGELKDIVHPSEVHENLFLIGSGPRHSNPAKLLTKPQAATLFNQLNEEFDCIVVDTPPVGLVTDAYLLREFANVSLFIVRFDVTEKAELEIIEDIYANQKLPNPAIVLNGIKPGTHPGYSSRFGKGYFFDEKSGRRSWWKTFRLRRSG